MESIAMFVLVGFLLSSIFLITNGADKITATQSIKEGSSIVSAGGSFELGFFSPKNSKNRYLGIWYKKIASGTVVWVANKDTPLNDSSGIFQLSGNGILSLLYDGNKTVWSSNSTKQGTNPVAQLLDTGNLVVRNNDDKKVGNYIWQSFDYPGNTLLPGMKYGISMVTGINRGLTSWKSDDDPSDGEFTNILDPNGVPQFYLRKGSVIRFRSGPWNGLRFSGMPNLKPNPIYTYDFVCNEKEIYYTYKLISNSVVSRLVLDLNGHLQRFTWIDRTKGWNFYLSAQMDDCDRYATCGPYGTCNINNSPACGCLEGFVPKSKEDYNSGDWSHGCERKTSLGCIEGEGFRKYSSIKLPDTVFSWYNMTMDLKECEQKCLKNCSCTAYANMDIRNGGSGCILWFKELIDIRQYADSGQDIYIRMASSYLEEYRSSKGKTEIMYIALPVVALVVALIGLSLLWYYLLKKRQTPELKRDETDGSKNPIDHARHSLRLTIAAFHNAWILYKEGKSLELVIDRLHEESCNIPQVLRSIQVALLCVQNNPQDRPNMSYVVLMLSSDIPLEEPKEPGFFTNRDLIDSDSMSTIREKSTTLNRLTITMLEAR
ncbi:hypothetical protein F8388_011313 [Cannabis sativa]|uniref:Uncharacterized protein n=1 Tax=Cannabis sativa TaxID=3483 RepID=A0A7J6FAW8_CANSA|nr:hypothetical protein F8388_011313 [Cannabis sativa]